MFQYYQPTQIYFGENRLNELGQIAVRYGTRCLMVTTPDEPLRPLYVRIIKLLQEQGITVFHFDQVQPNPTVEIVEAGFQLLKQNPVDFVLAVGGGSSIDTAKSIAFTNGQEKIDWDFLFQTYSSPYENYPAYSDTMLPLLVVPTTSGTGSQVTQAAVISRGDEKLTFYHPALFSKACVVDPTLMLTLPVRMTAMTGFDAFTHAFESYINAHASPYSEMDSLRAMELIVHNLPKALKDPSNLEYRTQLALADTLAGRALSNSGAAAPHPLSEIIGGLTHMPHGQALAVVFPAFVAQMSHKYPERFATVARIFDSSATDLYPVLCDFLREIGLYQKLHDLDVSEADFASMLSCPVLDFLPFGSREELEQILKDSYV